MYKGLANPSRRTALKTLAAFTAGLMVSTGFAGVALAAAPDYYPADYSSVVEASKQESGVLVYSNMGEMNWRPLIEAFNAEYPWIKVQTLDLGSIEVFERYYAETAAGNNATDVVVSHSSAAWLDFIKKDGVNAEYKSAEDGKLPAYSKPATGVYTISVDPYFIVYNKALLAENEWPKSIQDIVDLVAKDPQRFAHKIATGVPMSNAAAQNLTNTYFQHVGEEKALKQYEILGQDVDVYRSAGQIMEKLTTGEVLIGFMLSGIQVFPLLADPARAQILGYAFPSDGTVMLMRHIAMAKTAKNPNSSRLFIDFVLSKAGQTALSSGGLMSYRDDVELPDGPTGYTYKKIAAEVGDASLAPTSFDPKTMIPSQDLIDKVNAALHVQP
ncbi:ABC transporter substrate-binding protein [Paradevosia shaoguanensis]|jgi:iron(III) transport system substrate-binding protein|uniref:ABC transporter substrate-binding protein n=1 Tax=Paradevosia shaoguanensis TaxID=1335043 RepID=UPI00193294B1|nr:extracellular solute-binding protein [Paradevosia shaoguanensis]